MRRLLTAAASLLVVQAPVLAQQFTPQQMLDVMTKSPSNRDVRVHDDPDKLSADITLGNVLLNIVGDSVHPIPFGQFNR